MTDTTDLRSAYIELLIKSVSAAANGPFELYWPVPTESGPLYRRTVQKWLLRRGHARLAYPIRFDPDADPEGQRNAYQLPSGIMTMIGRDRLNQIRDCVIDVLERGVPGDLIETGVWRGGATILMRGVLKAYGVADRRVYVADSFEGLPPPDAEKYPADEGLNLHEHPVLAVGLDEVRANFERYGLLDEHVVFLKGWFRDTLPGLRDRTFAIARLDGDLYESTMDALSNIYPRLSPGGWLIIDDFHIPACVAAVEDYRREHGIADEISRVNTSASWIKSA